MGKSWTSGYEGVLELEAERIKHPNTTTDYTFHPLKYSVSILYFWDINMKVYTSSLPNPFLSLDFC